MHRQHGEAPDFMLRLRTALGKLGELQRSGEQIRHVLSAQRAMGSCLLSLSPKSLIKRETTVLSSPPCLLGTVCRHLELLLRK